MYFIYTIFFNYSFYKNTNEMQLILFIWFIFHNYTCFGRSPRPSSGVICLQTVVAATGVCYRYGVDKSRMGLLAVCL